MTSPPKNRKKLQNSEYLEEPSAPLNDPKLIPPKPFNSFLGLWVSPILVIAALFFFMKNKVQLGEVLVFLAIVVQIVKVYYEQRPSWAGGVAQRLVSVRSGSGLLFGLWIVFSVFLLTFTQFHWIVPQASLLPFQQSHWLLLLVWGGMIIFFRTSSESTLETDISARPAHFWLLTLFVLGFVLRFLYVATPAGIYGDDFLTSLSQLRYIADTGDYRNAFNTLVGERDPFYSFFTIFLFHLMPGASSLFVQRLSFTLFDLATFGVLYLLGKEVAGRRAGLFAVGTAVIGKAFLLKVVLGTSSTTNPLVLGLILLFSLRLVKKPDIQHFHQWGGVIALGIYTYTLPPPFIPLFLFAVLVWVFLKNKEKTPEWPAIVMVGTTVIFILIYFLYVFRAFPSDNWIARAVEVSGSFVPCMVLGLFFILALWVFPKMASQDLNNQWTGWVTGSWLCVVLTFPIMANEDLLGRRNGALLGGADFFKWSYFSPVIGNLKAAFRKIFWTMGDGNGSYPPDDPLFSYWEISVIALGLAFCFSKLNWKKWILSLAIIVGISPFVFTGTGTSEKLMGCVVPCFVIAGWGLNELMTRFFLMVSNREFYKKAAWIFLIGFWLWGIQGVVSRVYKQWAEIPRGNSLARQEVMKDLDHGRWVYLGPDLTPGFANILYEHHPARVWRNSNLICVGPNDKGPDVVVYLAPNSANIKNQLIQIFPTAQWNDIRSSLQQPNEAPALWRCFIPFSDILNYYAKYLEISKRPVRKSKLLQPSPAIFEIRQVSKPYWERRYFDGRQGLVLGILTWEDKVLNINDSSSVSIDLDQAVVQYKGLIHVDKKSRYEIAWKANNRTKIFVDGRKITDVYFPQYVFFPRNDAIMDKEKSGEKSLNLNAGDHQVEVITLFQRSRNAPEITLRQKGSPGEGRILWSAFNF